MNNLSRLIFINFLFFIFFKLSFSSILYEYQVTDGAVDTTWKYLSPAFIQPSAAFDGSWALSCDLSADSPLGQKDYFEKRFPLLRRSAFAYHFALDVAHTPPLFHSILRHEPDTTEPLLVFSNENFMDAPVEGLFFRQLLRYSGGRYYMEYEIDHPNGKLWQKKRADEVLPGHPNALEFQLTLAPDSTAAELAFRRNGKTDWQVNLAPLQYKLKNQFLKLGRYGAVYQFPGRLAYDDLAFGDSLPGSPPLEPVIGAVARGRSAFFPARIELFPPPFRSLSAGDRHAATRFQILEPGGAWGLPLYDTGPDSVDREAFRANVLLDTGKVYQWRVKHYGAGGRQSDWSRPGPLLFRTDSTWASRDSHPVLHRLFFTGPGSAQPLSRLQKGRWYDLVARVSSPLSFGHLAYLIVWINNEHYTEGRPDNKGGLFDPGASFAFNLAIDPNQVWEKSLPGKFKAFEIAEQKGAYLDATAGSYRVNPDDSTLRCRIRIPPETPSGTWSLRAVMRGENSLDSPLWQSMIELTAETEPGASPAGPWGVAALCAAALTVFFLVYFRRRTKPPGAAPPKPSEKFQRDDGIMEKFDRMIAEHLTQPLTLDEIEVKMGLSHSYLFRVVKRRSSLSVKNYILKKKMDRAAELLKTGDKNIKAVMYDVGFTDAAYFSKMFKKLKGVPPSEYRGQ